MKGNIAKNLVVAIETVICVKFFRDNCYEAHATVGPSMLPTISAQGDIVLLNKWKYRNGSNIKVGDVIVFKKPTDADVFVCKRVIGMPGDVVCKDPTLAKLDYVQVPKGHVWVSGDNLAASLDSRSYGPIPLGLIEAKVVAKLYPKLLWMYNNLSSTD